jgi:hypothetical protein
MSVPSATSDRAARGAARRAPSARGVVAGARRAALPALSARAARRLLSALAAAALLSLPAAAPAPARADDPDPSRDDGLYGRFDGDVWLGAEAGGGVTLGGGDTRPSGALALRARYLDSAGVFAFGELDRRQGRFGGGVELRPLFLARFLLGLGVERAFSDLLLDSLGLEIGLGGVTHEDALGRLRVRASLVVGGGAEVPLLLGAPRVSLRLAVRWVHGDDVRQAHNDVTFYAALSVAGPARTGLARREGPRARPLR